MRIIKTLTVMLLMMASPVWAAEKYTCPMHPHYIADVMGICPICGMDLVPIQIEEEAETGENEQEKKKITSKGQ